MNIINDLIPVFWLLGVYAAYLIYRALVKWREYMKKYNRRLGG